MPALPMPEANLDEVCVGEILAAHGLKGELKIKSLSNVEERFEIGNQCNIAQAPFTLTVESCRANGDSFLMQFAEVKDRSTADTLCGLILKIPEKRMGQLSAHTYWVHDIIGMSVETEAGENLGQVTQVLSTGANDVYEVASDPSISISERILLPAIADVIRSVDIQSGRLVVRLLPGLVKGK